jgi:CheY-like chemotaxis protein
MGAQEESTDRESGKRVLVVDDSATIRRIVCSVLERAGYETGQAADGAQALAALKRDAFQLALVDFVMPKVNGFELCRKLREDPALEKLPVVLMSAKADKIREHFLRQTGALDAISKPFDPRALLLTVEAAFNKAEAGRGRRELDSLPPTSGDGQVGSESTLNDASAGPPSSMRGVVPDAFVRRLAELLMKHGRALDGQKDLGAATTALRKSLGDTLATVHADLGGASARAVLAGDLGAIPLAEVLQLLQLQQQTGILTVFDDKTEVQIALRDGLIDLATSRGAADEFRLGRYVVAGGKLDRRQLDEFIARERQSGKGRLLGDALVAEGIISREDILRALEKQSCELIYDVLRWTRGRFVFDHRATKNEANAAQLGLPVASIVMEGFRRVDEWRLMEGSLGDFEQIFYRDAASIEVLGADRLTREERNVLMAVDGERSVRELIGTLQMGSFDVCKILYQLVQSRLVRRKLSA